jgi:hypothetical protein
MDVARLQPRRAPATLAALVLVLASGCAQTQPRLFGPTTAASFMNLIEKDPDPNVRYRAYQALGTQRVYDNSSQKARAARLLLSRLDPTREPLASRAAICRTLGVLGDPIARDALIRLVRDPDPQLKTEAIRALGQVGQPEDATVLMQIMTLDHDPDCKVAAIEGLGLLKIADPRTEGYLVQAMDDENPAIRLASLESLRKISGKDFGVQSEPWRKYILAKRNAPLPPPASGPSPPPTSTPTLPPLTAAGATPAPR